MNTQIQDLVKKLNILCQNPTDKEKELNDLRVASDGSHPDPLSGENLDELLSTISTNYQLTVVTKVQLSRRQKSLLLAILNYQAAHYGINLGMYLAMEHLSASLIGNKENPFEIKDRYERNTSCVSQILLSSVGNSNIPITAFAFVPESIVQTLIENKLLLDTRVYKSRKAVYRPEMLLLVTIVPLDVKFERTKGTSERYSSYCKGYGESHPSARSVRTKPSFELDGAAEDKDIYSLREIPELLQLNLLEIRARVLRNLQ